MEDFILTLLHYFFDLTSFYRLGQKYKNIFIHFLVQMKTLKFAFEIYWPLIISYSICVFYFFISLALIMKKFGTWHVSDFFYLFFPTHFRCWWNEEKKSRCVENGHSKLETFRKIEKKQVKCTFYIDIHSALKTQ